MARQISWRLVNQGVWRTPLTTPSWMGQNFGIVFEVTGGMVSSFKVTNATLKILKPIPGKRGKYELLRSKSIDSSYWAKEVVDALLLLARVSSKHGTPEDGYKLLLDTFDRLPDSPIPEQPELNELPTRIYSYIR